MDSDTARIGAAPASSQSESDSVSDASRIAGVLGAIALVMFLLFAGGLLLVIEVVGKNRPGRIEVDQQEIAEATRLVQNRSMRLDRLKHESAVLEERIQRIRSGEATRTVPESSDNDAAASPRSSSMALLASPNAALAGQAFGEPDEVSRLYCSLFLVRSQGGMAKLDQLTSKQKQEMARLVISGVMAGQADALIAANVIARIGGSEEKSRLIQYVFSSPRVVMDLSKSGSAGTDMIGLCQSLPRPQRVEKIRDLVMEFSSVEDTFMRAVEQSVSQLAEDERAKLAVWMAHADEHVRELAYRSVPEASLWEQAVAMLAGNQYNQFVYANRWIAQRSVNDRYRKDILAALGPVLLVRDRQAMPSLETFCAWADPSTADTIGDYLAEPLRDPLVIQRLVETALRLELPLVSMIDQSSDARADEWFKRYVEGDPQVTRAFRELLASDPPLRSTITWMDRMSREGGTDQVKDLQDAIGQIKTRKPDSLLANRAEELLRSMTRRLGLPVGR